MYGAVTVRKRLYQRAKSRLQRIGGSVLRLRFCVFITGKSDIQCQQSSLCHVADLSGAKSASPRITQPFVMPADGALPFFIRFTHFAIHAIQCAPESAWISSTLGFTKSQHYRYGSPCEGD
jgi:hypothetical protein